VNKINIKIILDLLKKEYRPCQFQPNHAPLAELVQTILSQNTADKNSRPAFKALMEKYDSWEKIILADPEKKEKELDYIRRERDRKIESVYEKAKGMNAQGAPQNGAVGRKPKA